MTRFFVTGASGLLGINFCLRVGAAHEVIGLVNRNPLVEPRFRVLNGDLTLPGMINTVLTRVQPEVVIHCAAQANVDQCEREPDLALHINAEIPGLLAAACRERGLRMIHISTDAVFDGQKGNYSEEDAPNPINAYARTKLAGEQRVAAANPEAVIARVNFYGWSLTGKRSLAELFYYNLAAQKPMMGFTDVWFNPLEVNDLVDVLVEMAEKDLHGLYHVISRETLSKYDFGCGLARKFGLDAGLIKPVSWREAGLAAVRSPNLSLNCEKLSRALGHALPGQADGMERFHREYEAGHPVLIRQHAGPASRI